ncbi:MAG: BON domain-containing protein [Planctomycetota bacterium]
MNPLESTLNQNPAATVKRIRVEYSDDDIRKRVLRFLSSRHFSTFRNIDVIVRHGEVTLTGTVCSFYEKQVALTSCRRVAGVLDMVDCIVVESIERIDGAFSGSRPHRSQAVTGRRAAIRAR